MAAASEGCDDERGSKPSDACEGDGDGDGVCVEWRGCLAKKSRVRVR